MTAAPASPEPSHAAWPTDSELKRLRELRDKATPGPWAMWRGEPYEGGGEDMVIGAGEEWLANMNHSIPRCAQLNDDGHKMDECEICMVDAQDITDEQFANAEFIAAARNALPALLSRLAAAEQAQARMREQISEMESKGGANYWREKYNVAEERAQRYGKEVTERTERLRELTASPAPGQTERGELELHQAVRDALLETEYTLGLGGAPYARLKNEHGPAHRRLRDIVASMEPAFSDELRAAAALGNSDGREAGK